MKVCLLENLIFEPYSFISYCFFLKIELYHVKILPKLNFFATRVFTSTGAPLSLAFAPLFST